MGFVIGRRILVGIPTLLGVTVVLFLVLRLLPGDPIAALLEGAPATPEMVAGLRQQFGLDKPLIVQYWDFLRGVFSLDLGTSYATRQPVAAMIAQQVAPTIELALAGAGVTTVVGIVFGSLAALRRNTVTDALIRVFSLIATSTPTFWVGLLLLLLFSFRLGWFPSTGSDAPATLVLPALTLGLAAAGTVIRLVRNSVLDVLEETFVVGLHAKGLSRQAVVFKHVLRNAVIPTVTIVGMQLAGLIAGSVVIETVFTRQGIGQLMVHAVIANDFPVVQGCALLIAVVYIAINIAVDISYAYIDPRIRDAVTNA